MTTYVTDGAEKFIPPSQRPDGTWRKARRVKPGYVPQEEVPLYESKGKQYAARKTGVPPGVCPFAIDEAKKERERQERAKAKAALTATGTSTQQQQGTRKKNKQTPGMLQLGQNPNQPASNVQTYPNQNNSNDTNAHVNSNQARLLDGLSKNLSGMTMNPDEGGVDAAKQLKKLRKKVREIDAIEAKVHSGELRKPDKDQVEKIKRKKDILKEIKRLEDEQQQATSSSGYDECNHLEKQQHNETQQSYANDAYCYNTPSQLQQQHCRGKPNN